MQIAEILHHKGREVSKIGNLERITNAIERLAEKHIGALVVVDRWGTLVGMFSERDVIHALARQGREALDCVVHEFMSQDVTTCGPEDRIDDVMATMTAHRVRHLPVMENGRLVGLASIGDLVKAKLLEMKQEANILREMNLTRF